jgi:Na+-transporting NADH:ubiquinone oxidoreductase subunit F
MPKVIFQSSAGEKEIEVVAGESLLAAADRAGWQLKAACGGAGSCGLCKIKILESVGELNAPTESECAKLGSLNLRVGERLACQVAVGGNLKFEMP